MYRAGVILRCSRSKQQSTFCNVYSRCYVLSGGVLVYGVLGFSIANTTSYSCFLPHTT